MEFKLWMKTGISLKKKNEKPCYNSDEIWRPLLYSHILIVLTRNSLKYFFILLTSFSFSELNGKFVLNLYTHRMEEFHRRPKIVTIVLNSARFNGAYETLSVEMRQNDTKWGFRIVSLPLHLAKNNAHCIKSMLLKGSKGKNHTIFSSSFPESCNLPSFKSKINKIDLISLSSQPSLSLFFICWSFV